MLVLSRKPLQSIMIGPDIRITIVKVERNQVRIGIEAPRNVTILRDELIPVGAGPYGGGGSGWLPPSRSFPPERHLQSGSDRRAAGAMPGAGQVGARRQVHRLICPSWPRG